MVHLTASTKPAREKNIQRTWRIVDVKGKVLGRVAPQAAMFLQGKHKPSYAPYLDAGDYVVVINAKDVILTGKKLTSKLYTQYSGYPGGLKSITAEKLMQKDPTQVIRKAISGMLPKNKLRDKRLARLFIFKDGKHPHEDKFKVQSSMDSIILTIDPERKSNGSKLKV